VGELHDELSRGLYEHDPESMGSSVGAPDNEYDDDAIELIRGLAQRRSTGSVTGVVRDLWPEAGDDLVASAEQAWRRYVDRTGDDRR
jgi:hypothetical protein